MASDEIETSFIITRNWIPPTNWMRLEADFPSVSGTDYPAGTLISAEPMRCFHTTVRQWMPCYCKHLRLWQFVTAEQNTNVVAQVLRGGNKISDYPEETVKVLLKWKLNLPYGHFGVFVPVNQQTKEPWHCPGWGDRLWLSKEPWVNCFTMQARRSVSGKLEFF